MRSTLLFSLALLATAHGANKVVVKMLSESKCPNCIDFLRDEVQPTFSAEGIWNITEFQYVPWGNSYTETAECPNKVAGAYDASTRTCWNALCGSAAAPATCWDLTTQICQHGAAECRGDRYETCALAIAQSTPQKWLDFVLCFMVDHKGSLSYVTSCAEQAGINTDKLEKCAAEGSLVGDQLEYRMINATNADGPHSGVPWVTVNGEKVESGLLKAVCNAYTGVKPAGCANVALLDHKKVGLTY